MFYVYFVEPFVFGLVYFFLVFIQSLSNIFVRKFCFPILTRYGCCSLKNTSDSLAFLPFILFLFLSHLVFVVIFYGTRKSLSHFARVVCLCWCVFHPDSVVTRLRVEKRMNSVGWILSSLTPGSSSSRRSSAAAAALPAAAVKLTDNNSNNNAALPLCRRR